jgi:hypothetical protein
VRIGLLRNGQAVVNLHRRIKTKAASSRPTRYLTDVIPTSIGMQTYVRLPWRVRRFLKGAAEDQDAYDDRVSPPARFRALARAQR